MKHTGFACLAAFALSVLAALPFAGCGKEETAAAPSASPAAGTATSNSVFDKTIAPLEQGGVAFSFTDGTAAYQMVDRMFDSFNGMIPEDVPEAQKVLDAIRTFAGDEFGLKTFLGSGTSVKKIGDYYRCIDFEYAPEHKGLFWDIIGAAPSKGPAPELKLTSPNSALAFSIKAEPGTIYAFVDKKLRETLDEDTMAVIDQQISSLHNSGIQPDKLLECISGVTFYVEAREFKEEELQGVLAGDDVEAQIAGLVPKFALIFTTKSDLCWKALENFISQSAPDIVKDGKIVPVEGFAVFQAGNYLIATNEEAAIRDRIAGKGKDLTDNAEFAKMLQAAGNDFSSFSWVSEQYFKTVFSYTKALSGLAGGLTGGAVPATDPTIFFANGLHSALWTMQINADGILSTSITPDLQIALLNSNTLPGIVAGFLPYAGPVAQIITQSMNDDNEFDIDTLGRQVQATAAFAMLKEAEIPADSLFFNLGEEGDLVFAKLNAAGDDFDIIPADADEDEFPFILLTSPDAAAKADKPEEIVVFYENPAEFVDGIFVVFGDGSVKFLEGDFDDHAEALEAAANTFDLSDKAAADLIKKGADIDKLFTFEIEE